MAGSKNNQDSLESQSLSIGFAERPLAEGLDVKAAAGSICVIAGPNGAGKSTLLRTLARQLRPLKGQVFVGGRNIWDMGPAEFARQVAYVPQFLEPGHDFTVSELALTGRNPHQPWWSWGVSAADREAVEAALRATDAWSLRDKHFLSLSGGEKQRVMIAQALAQETRFMLLDEPTAHLDFKHQLELAALLTDLASKGLGIILVLHDLSLIAHLADTVFFLRRDAGSPQSTVAAFGDAEDVLQPAVLEEVYGVEVSVVREPISGRAIYTPVAISPRHTAKAPD